MLVLREDCTVETSILEQRACASAIRGIRTDGIRIWAAGLNQRLSVWGIIYRPKLQLQFEHSEVIDCADVNALDISETGVLVAGAGFCVFKRNS